MAACMAMGLVKGEGFALDGSVVEANASRYHGQSPRDITWTDAQRQKRAVAEYLEASKRASVRRSRKVSSISRRRLCVQRKPEAADRRHSLRNR
jgi:hypothetical protein